MTAGGRVVPLVSNANPTPAKAFPGRPRRIMREVPLVCRFPWLRAAQSSSDSSRMFERSGLRARSEFGDVPREPANERVAGAQHRPPRGCAAACPDTPLPPGLFSEDVGKTKQVAIVCPP